VVVMCQTASRFLQEIYKVPEPKIALIPHGIPDVPFVDPAFHKDQFGLAGRKVMLTFGLLSPGKGIETAIKALPAVVERHPDVVYVVLGAIHPHIFRREGNTYLASLELLAKRLGVQEHVVFCNRYVTLEELCGYLGASDMYVTPYVNRAQIVSGTLAYAMGAGKAVISTPYWHAEEMLAEERGILFPFGNAEALAEAANGLLDDPLRLNRMRKRAYMYCRPMVWREVGRQYLRLAEAVLEDRRRRPRPVFHLRAKRAEMNVLPEVSMAHLRTLTDDTGVMQHAVYAVPDRNHGYCTDDNSRALLAVVDYYDMTQDETVLPMANRYMSFLHHAFDPKSRRFRNFLSYDRQWVVREGGEDVHGRAIWALGRVVSHAGNDATLTFASRLFASALESAESLKSPRAWAFALVGIHAYLERFSGDAFARRTRAVLAKRLGDLFARNASADWPWCEDVVTYDNGKLPHALILSGQWLPDARLLDQGLKARSGSSVSR